MARRRKTLRDIEAQRQRAIKSIDEVRRQGSIAPNVYRQSQRLAYEKQPRNTIRGSVSRLRDRSYDAWDFGDEMYRNRRNQIDEAAMMARANLRAENKQIRAARKAQGLSAG